MTNAAAGSWESDLKQLIDQQKIICQFIIFPLHPPHNDSLFIANHAYRSDFVRMMAFEHYGGIYLDTDAFFIK